MFEHNNTEFMRMQWFKKDLWKTGPLSAGMLLLMVLMVWVPVSATNVQEGALGLATRGAVTDQATPTADATMIALNKEKLKQEIQQIKNQNEPDLFRWLKTNAGALLSPLVLLIGGLFGLWRWLVDRRSERKKRDEERFQATVTGFGNEEEDAKIAAATTLRTFLRPGYEQFYIQSFDLAVANLRIPHPSIPLSQALIAAFTQAFPLAREWVKQGQPPSLLQRIEARLKLMPQVEKPFDPRSLDASHIILDKAFLWRADLEQVFMPWASLQETGLTDAKLHKAALWHAKLDRANL